MAAITAAVLVWQNWDDIVSAVRDTWNDFGERFPVAAQIIETAIDAILTPINVLRTAFSTLVDVFQNFSIETIFTGLRERVVGILNNILVGIENVLSQLPGIGGRAAQAFRDNVLGPFQETYIEAVGASIIPDMVRDIREQMSMLPPIAEETAGGFMENTLTAFQQTLEGARDVMGELDRLSTRTFDGLADGLTDFVTTGMADFGRFAQSIIRDLIRIQIRAQLARLFGAFGGGGGLFAGFFNQGGRIPSGQFGIAGENGPEIIRGPAAVTSTADTADLLSNTGANSNITLNVSAVDARSFEGFVMSPRISEAIANAVNANERTRGIV